jgi:cytoskeletal protein CcmA (bactofilin family)
MWKRDESLKPSSASRGSSEENIPADSEPTDKVVMNLGKSIFIKGELSASEDVTLDGRMEGSITLPDHTLTIGPDADIKATIAAKIVVIMGAVTGNVSGGERVEIQKTGSVAGDIDTPRLVIADGGRLCGKVQMPDVRSVPEPQQVVGD